MGQFTVTYPEGWRSEIILGIRAALGEEAKLLSNAEVAQKWLLRCLKDIVQPIALREAVEPVVLASNTALAEKEAAAKAAVQARLDAEAAVRVALDTDFGV